MSEMQYDKVVEKEEIITKPPPKYKVMFFNDDFTPFDFVVTILVKFFNKNTDEAAALATKVHEQGSATVGAYTREIAETKTNQTLYVSKFNGFPLKVEVIKE